MKTRSALGYKRIQLRSLCVQRDLLRASSSPSSDEERKIGRDEGSARKPVRRKKGFRVARARGTEDVHQISHRRCSALPSSEWVLIDPATEAEKEGRPSEDPVQHASGE